ncbi:MAG: class II glutamine amidotransferase [Atopobiaceae bacterium]
MCELFAVNAKSPVVVNDYLREFYSHSIHHPHGWGLALRDSEGSTISLESSAQREGGITLYKEPVAAYQSQLLARLLDQPIAGSHITGHIRNSTCGKQTRENCHPFIATDMFGTEWSMAHNGILFNEELSWSYDRRESGETDSERAMLFFLDCLDEAGLRKGAPLDFDDRFDALASAIAQFSNLNRLNVILSDGTYTYVHTNTDKYTLWYRQLPDAVVISTHPLGGEDERPQWKPVPQYRLIAFKDGRIVRTSAPHGYVFCEAILELRKVFGDDWQAAVA